MFSTEPFQALTVAPSWAQPLQWPADALAFAFALDVPAQHAPLEQAIGTVTLPLSLSGDAEAGRLRSERPFAAIAEKTP